jgi:hypothetical protein
VDPSDSEFDLTAWVADTMPALLEAEAAEGWTVGGTEVHPAPQPVTRLAADGSPLQAFLRADTAPPEGASREERGAFHEAREASERAAREAVLDAADDHAGWIRAQGQRRALDALDGALSKASQQVRRAEEEHHEVPVRGPSSTDLGRW